MSNKLAEGITNVYMRYRVLGDNPKAAFLYFIATHNAMSFDKVRALANIVVAHPDVLANITDNELYRAFLGLRKFSASRGEIMSYLEMNWVSVYLKDVGFRTMCEEMIYIGFLMADQHWDKGRKGYAWTIPEDRKNELVVEVLKDVNLGSMRKMQLAEEFGLPHEAYAAEHFTILLWNRHYAQAAQLKKDGKLSDTDDLAIGVIKDDINAGYISDAMNIADEFLSHRQDIIGDLKGIQKRLKPASQEATTT